MIEKIIAWWKCLHHVCPKCGDHLYTLVVGDGKQFCENEDCGFVR